MAPRLNVTECSVLDLGLIEYQDAWKLQEEYALEIAQGTRSPTLLLLEHPPVYTFGRSGRSENLLWGEQQLKERCLNVHWVDRGGDVTYHGPGQLVGYPLLPLGRPSLLNADAKDTGMKVDYIGYLRMLEMVLIQVLAHFGLASGQRQGFTGVWVQADVASRCACCKPEDRLKPAKIAAIGVKVDSRGISRHGFALNVNPDMTYWEGIVACGLVGDPVVSLADLLIHPPDIKQVKQAVIEAFGEVMDYEMNEVYQPH